MYGDLSSLLYQIYLIGRYYLQILPKYIVECIKATEILPGLVFFITVIPYYP